MVTDFYPEYIWKGYLFFFFLIISFSTGSFLLFFILVGVFFECLPRGGGKNKLPNCTDINTYRFTTQFQ